MYTVAFAVNRLRKRYLYSWYLWTGSSGVYDLNYSLLNWHQLCQTKQAGLPCPFVEGNNFNHLTLPGRNMIALCATTKRRRGHSTKVMLQYITNSKWILSTFLSRLFLRFIPFHVLFLFPFWPKGKNVSRVACFCYVSRTVQIIELLLLNSCIYQHALNYCSDNEPITLSFYFTIDRYW